MTAIPAPTTSAQRLGILAITVFVLVFGCWLWLAPLHSAVVTTGLVKTATNRKVVQHTTGGIVKSILVNNGDSVKEGQPLIILEDVRVDATQKLLVELALLESIKLDRLDAEQQLAGDFSVSPERRRTDEPVLVEKAYQRELTIFRTRRSLLDEQLTSYERQMLAIADEQKALERQKELSREASKLARDEFGLNATLEREKFVSRARLIALERAVAELGAKQSEHEAMLAQSEQRKNDLALRMASARNQYQRVAAEEFKESNRRVLELREQLRPAEDAARRKVIVAPVSGKVLGLRLNAPGEVAPPTEPLMEIVQDNEGLLVEAKVGVDAIKHLRPGQLTELRFTTFNSRTTPLVQADLSYISADAMTDKDGTPHYVIQARPHAEALRSAGIPALKPGMAAEVFVLIESRSTLDYLLAPITDTLRRSLREP